MNLRIFAIFFYQAHWAWIFNSENKIEKRDKPTLLKMMRKLVYSRTNEEFNNKLQTMRSSQTYLKYENYAQHINEKILPRRDEWSLLFRIESQLPTNNVNTSNYAEVSFRVTKDLKFNRHRAFNQLELLTIALWNKSNGSYDIKDFGPLPLIFSTSKYFRWKFQPCPSFFCMQIFQINEKGVS